MNKRTILSAMLAISASVFAYGAVPDGWSVQPGDGDNVEEIKTFVVKHTTGRFDTYVNRKVVINGTDYPITQKVTGTYDDVNTITLQQDAITADGTYNVVIPSGTFDYNYNWMTDEGDPNPEISFTLTIGGGDTPGPEPGDFTPIDNPYYIISPEQGVVGKIQEFTVEYQRSALFPEGYGSNKPVLVNEETGQTVATFSVEEGGGMRDVILTLPEPYTVPGTYLVNIPDNGICGYDDVDWPAASFRYVIDGSVTPEDPQETVSAYPESGTSVTSLDEILLYFPNIAEVYASGPAKDNVTVTRDGNPTDITATFNLDPTTMDTGEIGLRLSPALTETGEYEIHVPARALSLSVATFDSRYNYEFTLKYTVKGPLADGTKIKIEPLTYKVVSGVDHTLSVTFPSDESEYSGVTAIPAHVEYEGEQYTVVEVGYLSFSEVKGITSITIPETVTTIAGAAFWESSLSEITIPSSVTTIGESAFENTNLTEIVIPESVLSLGDDVLSLCASLESVTLNNNPTAIPARMVSGCTSLAGMTIPATVTKIGEFAFSECAALEDISLPSGVTEIGRFAFAYTPELKLLPLPETVTSVGHGVFYQSGIEEASLPEAITVIPDGMYQCCASLREFEISNTVTEIEQEAFYWCFALDKITFGESVTTIGNKAFMGDKALTSVTSLNTVPPVGAAFDSEVYENAILYVPNAALEAYKAADGWKEFNNIIGIGSGVDEIGQEAAFSVTAIDGGIEVVSDKAVEIFDAAGMKVYSGAAGTISLPGGFYVIVSGAETVKVVL